jgi:DNA-binding NtrC family response regulator
MTDPAPPPIDCDDVGEGETLTLLDEGPGMGAAPVELVVLGGGPGRTRVLPFADGAEIVIGRSDTAAVRVEDPAASRRHAVLRREGARIVLRDMGSRNGTMLRGHTIRDQEALVAPGDWLRVGGVDMFVAVRLPGRDLDQPGSGGRVENGAIVVADPAMQRCFVLSRRLARADTTVLLLGETGVGKEVLADQIHRHSSRSERPLVRLNCASLPESLLESELFGHERGAFTGATQRRIGYVEAANGGTLFLDEIGEIPQRVQAKLLRVLEAQAFARIGSTTEIAVDVRFVCATHRDLKAEVQASRFRQDFYFRVAAFTIRVPPLRERRAEIPLLAALFARRFAERTGATPPPIDAEAMGVMMTYAWPGNVRELRNAIEHALVLSDGGPIGVACLPEDVLGAAERPSEPDPDSSLPAHVADLERQRIEVALHEEGGNQTRTAQRLGITRSALLHRLRKYGIVPA